MIYYVKIEAFQIEIDLIPRLLHIYNIVIEDDNTCHVNCCAGDKGRTGPKGDTGPQGEEGSKGDKGHFLYFNLTFVVCLKVIVSENMDFLMLQFFY